MGRMTCASSPRPVAEVRPFCAAPTLGMLNTYRACPLLTRAEGTHFGDGTQGRTRNACGPSPAHDCQAVARLVCLRSCLGVIPTETHEGPGTLVPYAYLEARDEPPAAGLPSQESRRRRQATPIYRNCLYNSVLVNQYCVLVRRNAA